MSANINFGSCGHQYTIIKNPNLLADQVKHTTSFFREGLDWDTLSEAILQSPTRDIYVGACSDGSEAISLKMILDRDSQPIKGPKFKIMAFDIGKENIAMAKCGIISLASMIGHYDDIKCMNWVGKDIFDKNLEKIPGSNYIAGDITGQKNVRSALFKMSRSLRDSIEFTVADAVDFSKQTFEKPIVFMFRNAWSYLNTDAQNELAHNLEQHLPKHSLVVAGQCDETVEPLMNLGKSCFEEVANYGSSKIFRHK